MKKKVKIQRLQGSRERYVELQLKDGSTAPMYFGVETRDGEDFFYLRGERGVKIMPLVSNSILVGMVPR